MISAEYLRSILAYEPETGLFRWRSTRGGHAIAGQIAGYLLPNGYRSIVIDGKRYLAHRLAWLYTTGTWPNAEIDHIDRVRDNNAFANLRAATRSQNLANASLRADNTSGLKGVSFYRPSYRPSKPWRATINIDGRTKHLGYFATKEEAHAARTQAARATFGEFACETMLSS